MNAIAARFAQLTQLKASVDGGVALLEMNFPPVNAMSRTLSDELTATLDFISETDEVRAVVLTGAGKNFCAGADLKGRADTAPDPERDSR